MNRPTTIERAFELARSGPCETIDELRSQLKRERHEAVDGHLSGASIGRQLRALFLEKQAAKAVGTAT